MPENEAGHPAKPTWWARPRLRTDEEEGRDRKVGWLELFYDLVFVVVVSQLSHRLATHPDWTGFGEFVLLYFPAFWMWIGGTIYTERFESEDLSHRVVVVLQMLAVGLMAVFVHDGTGSQSQAFALSYAAGRALICLLWFRGGLSDPKARPVTDRYIAGFSVSIVLFATSVLVPTPLRFVFWVVGLTIDLVTPTFALPHQRMLPKLSRGRLPERFGLFVLIVLGETIVSIIGGLSDTHDPGLHTFAAAGLALLVVFGFWWLYFDVVAHRPAKAGPRTSMARNYLHFPLLIAITTVAAGVLDALAAPTHLDAHVRWLLAGGTALALATVALIQGALTPGANPPGLWQNLRLLLFAVAALAAAVGAFATNLGAVGILALLAAIVATPIAWGATMWAKGKLH